MDIRDFEYLVNENTKVILARDGANVMVLNADTKVVLETVADDRIKMLTTQLNTRSVLRSYDSLLKTIVQNLSDAQLKTYFHISDKDKPRRAMELAFAKIVNSVFVYFHRTAADGNGIGNLIDSIIESYECS